MSDPDKIKVTILPTATMHDSVAWFRSVEKIRAIEEKTPVYDYVCACSARFEMLVPSWSTPDPDCPECGAQTVRRPRAPAMRSGAQPPPAMSTAPQSWEGVGHGDRETITRWRRAEAGRDRRTSP